MSLIIILCNFLFLFGIWCIFIFVYFYLLNNFLKKYGECIMEDRLSIKFIKVVYLLFYVIKEILLKNNFCFLICDKKVEMCVFVFEKNCIIFYRFYLE